MKKNVYAEMLAATIMTDENTLGEAKKARKTINELKRFWKKAALRNIQEETGRDLFEESKNWKELRFAFTLKPTGTITVELWAHDDFRPATLAEKFTVRKSNILV